MDESGFILLYKSMVRPHLEYANSVWCPYKLEDIKEIEKVQKRATKLIINFNMCVSKTHISPYAQLIPGGVVHGPLKGTKHIYLQPVFLHR